jgi:hypothetical protein
MGGPPCFRFGWLLPIRSVCSTDPYLSRKGDGGAPLSGGPSDSPRRGDSPTACASGRARIGAAAGRPFLCVLQQLGHRHSTARVPSGNTLRVSRHPKVALMSV